MGRLQTRFAITAASLLIACTAFLVATVFLIVAAYLALATMMAPWLAALATAGAAIVFALLVIVIARMMTGGRRGRFDGERVASDLGDLLGQQVRSLARKNGRTAILVSLVAGFAVGVSPKLRATLLKLF